MIPPKIIKGSLPHLTDEERNEVLSRYLGTASWEEIVEHFGLRKMSILSKNIHEVGLRVYLV